LISYSYGSKVHTLFYYFNTQPTGKRSFLAKGATREGAKRAEALPLAKSKLRRFGQFIVLKN